MHCIPLSSKCELVVEFMIQMELKACSLGSMFTIASDIMLQIYERLNMYGNKIIQWTVLITYIKLTTATTGILHFPHPTRTQTRSRTQTHTPAYQCGNQPVYKNSKEPAYTSTQMSR